MITLTYEFKLEPTKQQAEEMQHILDLCRSVWNYALRERKDWSASRKCPVNACSIRSEYIMPADAPYPNYFHQAKALTQAKKASKWLQSVNAQVLQQTLKTLDRAHADMKKQGKGYPRDASLRIEPWGARGKENACRDVLTGSVASAAV